MARSLEERLKQAAEKVAALKAELAREDAKKKAEASKALRKLENKKKILLGAYALDRMEREDRFQADTMSRLDKFLVRPADRAIFGLPAMRPSPSSGASDGV